MDRGLGSFVANEIRVVQRSATASTLGTTSTKLQTLGCMKCFANGKHVMNCDACDCFGSGDHLKESCHVC